MPTIKTKFPQYTCPFCQQTIKASSKTDIFYKSDWIKGCYDCFALSIDKNAVLTFQTA